MNHEFAMQIRGVSHWFGSNKVLYDLNLEVVRGEIVSMVGPSGCGKSTLLRAIVGTHPPNEGEIIVFSEDHPNGHSVKSPGRDRGIVYQRYSLFPFLTARENIALGPLLDETTFTERILQWGKCRKLHKQHLETAEEWLVRLGLEHAIHLYPHELSGGMQQRVAIAQALVMKPEILLLDEPFGALDEATREELQEMLLGLYVENCEARKKGERPPYTIMIVTHELNEAIYVGDRVIGLSQYWDWKGAGLAASPGATFIYDKLAPVYHPTSAREFEQFGNQRSEIRKAVFDPEFLQARDEFTTFWQGVNAGAGGGILE
jgi:NitT/TauT family transport system ATP-binding protein